jgi:hypothetical protein
LTALRARRFRSASRAWFAGADHRLRLARLHGQMAALCTVEVDAVVKPRSPLTPEEISQVGHLGALGGQAAERMERLAPGARDLPFYDFIFESGGQP